MKSSEQTNEVSAALAKAQGAINNPSKDSLNPHFNANYADLAGGINAIRAGLSANGIAYIQATHIDGEVMVLDTRLSHASGQWIECDYPVCKFPIRPQEAGSALTFARRYALFAMVGIAGEDDDGNAAQTAKIEAPQQFIKPEQVEELDTLLVELGEGAEEAFKKYFKIEFLGRLPAAEFGTAKKILAKKKAKQDAERDAVEEDKLIMAHTASS